MDFSKNDFALKLKSYRKKMGLTQGQVADLIGKKRSAYSYYETGVSEPPLYALKILADVYNTTADELLSPLESCASGRQDYSFSDEKGVDEKFNDLSDYEKIIVLRFRLMNAKQKSEFISAIDRIGAE
jgi:transcriptional regulator with XRE-family HTH domain